MDSLKTMEKILKEQEKMGEETFKSSKDKYRFQEGIYVGLLAAIITNYFITSSYDLFIKKLDFWMQIGIFSIVTMSLLIFWTYILKHMNFYKKNADIGIKMKKDAKKMREKIKKLAKNN